jgi:hypothetical protein
MRAVLLGIVIHLATPAQSTTAGSNYLIAGMGLKSCGELLQDYRQNPARARDLYATWLVGFISGTNSVCIKQMRPDQYGSEAFVRNWCERHPLSSVAIAAHMLRVELGGPAVEADCK